MAILRGGILLVQEVATGTVDGVNKSFTTANKFIAGTLRVYLNGLRLRKPDDFTETSDQSFDFVLAPIGGSDTDVVIAEYQRA